MSVPTGFCYYRGVYAQQVEGAFRAFDKLFAAVKPVRVLEIGTAGGGFTTMLKDGLPDAEIVSYDIAERPVYASLRERGVKVVIQDFFTVPDLMKNFIQAPGLTLVLCDGGNKIKEFKTIAPFLKKGDIIMAHDYIDTDENFRANYLDKIWNWREIGDEDIATACVENGLKPFMKATFDPVVWVCRQKQ